MAEDKNETIKAPDATVRADGTVLADHSATKPADAGETRRQTGQYFGSD